MSQIIYLAGDHAGFKLKEEIKSFLIALGSDVTDMGPYSENPEDDYPDFVSIVAREVSKNIDAKGIVIGGSGQGEAIVCNRFKGIRAVVFNGQYKPIDNRVVPDVIKLSREHNDSNILSLGARFLSENEAKIAVNKWLGTKFSGEERHVRRIKKIDDLII